MSIASLFGGLALANAGLGVVHGFAAPIGGMFDARTGPSAPRFCLTE
jgi:alcohol dehydrogenase class IV